MGQSSQKQRKKNQLANQDELKYYIDVHDPNLGTVQIYTCHKYQLCYILKHQYKNQDTKILNTFHKIQSSNLNPLLSLYGCNIQKQTCLNQLSRQKIYTYWQYYNFYFNQYLQKRRRQNLQLVDSQIWHIVQTCCQTYNLLRKFGVYYEINPQTFVITPQGKLKAFWYHLRSQNRHIKYIQYFDSEYKMERFAYSPEELQFMYNKERTTKLDFDKCNSYRLGILLLECLSLVDPLANCYNPSMTAIKSGAVKNLIHYRVVPHYPTEIVSLLKSLLKQNPENRPNLQQVYENYFGKFNLEFELRVCGMRNADQSHNLADFLDLGQQQMGLQNGHKKQPDESDDKTVKIKHSVRHH